MSVTILMLGDIVGEPGLAALEKKLPALVAEHSAAFVVVNGENAAAGFGLDEASLARILAAGADAVTSGNHIWEKREFWPTLEAAAKEGKPPLLRPANYFDAPGTGFLRIEKKMPDGEPLEFLVVNLQGRERMSAIDCPFRCFDKLTESEWNESDSRGGGGAQQPCATKWERDFTKIHRGVPPIEGNELDDGKGGAAIKLLSAEGCPQKVRPPLILVDFHAESTEEKEALAYYCDGRAGVVAGTHTHIQTADERVLPAGTAYITDLGMTGAMNGVIGMDAGICVNRARNQIAYRMECAAPESEADLAVQGIAAELDEETGRALSIKRVRA